MAEERLTVLGGGIASVAMEASGPFWEGSIVLLSALGEVFGVP